MIEDWKMVPLSELADFYSGGTPRKDHASFWGGDIPWVTVKNMKSIRLREITRGVTASGAATVRLVPAGAVLVLVRGMGLFKDLPVTFCHRPVTFNQDIKALVTRKGIDGEFLAYALTARKSEILRHVDSAGHGTGRLDTDLLKDTLLLLPPLPEQHKIVKILRAWDEAIEKLEVLKAAKERCSRAIFRRFFDPCHPNFDSRPPSWREYKLGELFTERLQGSAPGDRLLSITMSAGVIDRDKVGRKDTSTSDKSQYKLILPGDIGYNTMRMWQGVSGLSALRGIVSPAYTVVTPIPSFIDIRYAAHLFKSSRRMVFDFERYSQGLVSDTWNLKFHAFSKIGVFLPPIDEQRAQVNLLDALIDEIGVIELQIKSLTRQKRGLMQKLLTGEWRVRSNNPNNPQQTKG